ncbi:Citrate synthase [Balamuthia mandrillaris]
MQAAKSPDTTLDLTEPSPAPPGSIVAARRLNRIGSHILPQPTAADDNDETQAKAPSQDHGSLTVIDNRTGKKIQVPLYYNTFKAAAFKDLGLKSYDPSYAFTASATSRITFIDGGKGILRYRGYPIEELAEKSSFLEVAYLLIKGELPDQEEFNRFQDRIMQHTYIHENLVSLMKNFRYDSHPMGQVISSIAALSTFYPEANASLSGQGIYKSEKIRNKQIYRIIGKLPTIAACAYRHRIGRPYNEPLNHLSYTENFLYMLDHLQEKDYKPHPTLVRALDVLFILHADHELNCSTAAMRHIASSLADPYTAVAGAAGALYGPLHGGANEAVLRMLEDIGSVDKVSEFLEGVKNKKRKLMGFGHRVYKNYDPRAKIIKQIAYEVFDLLGKEPLIEVAVELERQALADDYFASRRLYPNVDFYSGLIYKAMGFPTDMFPVLFLIPRAVGWLAHWLELLDDPENKIVRPFQVYVGEELRHYAPIEQRQKPEVKGMQAYASLFNKRRHVSLQK